MINYAKLFLETKQHENPKGFEIGNQNHHIRFRFRVIKQTI